MLKAENPKAAKKHGENWLMSTDKLLIFQRDEIEQRLCVEDYNFIQDKKGSRQATFGANNVKLVKKLKHNLSRKKYLKREERHPS